MQLNLFNRFTPHEYMSEAGENKPLFGSFAFWAEEVAAQKAQLFLWWPVFLALGIGFYFSLGFEPPLILGVAAVVLAGSGLVLGWHSRGKAVLLLCLLVSMGFLTAQIRTMVSYTPMLEKKINTTQIIGTIERIERFEGESGSRITFVDADVEDLDAEKTPRKIRLRVRKDEGLLIGQRVQALASLMPPSAPVMPGGFDFQRYLYFQNIGAVGFVYSQPEVLDITDSKDSEFFSLLREEVMTRVRTRLEDQQGAMAAALLTADRAGIAESDKEAMRHSGLAHVLAISGLHIGLFSGVVFFAVRLFMAFIPGMALKYPIKKYAAVFAFGAACFYAALAGFPIPTQRALIMVGIVFLAIILDRSPLSMRLVSFAAFMVLLIHPESLLSASFHMSFAAVFGLVTFFDWLRPYSSSWYRQTGIFKRMALYFLGVVLTTLIASLATAPFALFHFQKMATMSVFANMLAIPLVAFVIMPSAVMALFLMPLGLEGLALDIMGYGIEQMLIVAHYFSSGDYAVWRVPLYPLAGLIGVTIGFLILILWKGHLRVMGGAVLLLSVWMIMIQKQPDILVSSDFDLVMFWDDMGEFHISSRQKGKFTAENWEQAYGLEPGTALRWPKEGDVDGFVCDTAACRLELKGAQISFLKESYAFEAECTWADLVIGMDFLEDKRCESAIVKDRFSGARQGSYAFWIEDGAVTYTNVRRQRGDRPWTQ